MDSVDRISELPDSVLCEILSYLPTKLSVSTSILAKRWRFLWTEVPNLDLNSKDHNGMRRPRPKNFSDVIYRVLLRHNVKAIDTFRLTLVQADATSKSIDYRMETWIAIAIARKVRNFHLYDNYGSLMLPRCIFTGKTFVDLRLSRFRIPVPLPDEPCFPHLKTLHLEAVEFEGDDGLQQLISVCPVLHELFINKVWDGDFLGYSISSPTIKRLTVNFRGYYSWKDNHKRNYTLEINAPALSYLRVDDLLSQHISAEMLSVLTEADILIKNKNDKHDVDEHSDSVLFFVDELYNVSRLKLSIDHTPFLDSDFSESNNFDNLTKLELSADWRFITMFLEYAANLEVLTISKVDNEELKCWMEPEQVPMCLVLHLKTVRIDQFRYAEDEFKMVRYILCNAQVLKTMEICFDTQGSLEQEKDSAVERISQFERGSEACELQFH